MYMPVYICIYIYIYVYIERDLRAPYHSLKRGVWPHASSQDIMDGGCQPHLFRSGCGHSSPIFFSDMQIPIYCGHPHRLLGGGCQPHLFRSGGGHSSALCC